MTSYTAIPNGDIDQDSPITQPLITALRDNPIAIAERDASVPANLFPTVLLGTLTTTSGTTATLSGLTLTSYSQLVCVFNGVSLSSVPDQEEIYIGTTGAGIIAQLTGANNLVRGFLWIDLATGIFASNIAETSTANPASGVSTVRGGICATTTASTSITFGRSTGNFDAGSIRIYGVK
jgi:hypothetical protein